MLSGVCSSSSGLYAIVSGVSSTFALECSSVAIECSALNNFIETHEEYWIPAEDLEEFNKNIVGKIEVIIEFKGS